jgi:tripartite-type tricarboxylate transporter receptor subunit TctC
MECMMRALSFIYSLVLACAVHAGHAQAQDFYKGKTITFLVGSGAGGGYDVYARVYAQHVVAHMPGQPVIIIKNMPAAAGLAAASALYTAPEKDGLTIAALPNGAAMDALFGNPGARFDSLRFNWIGSIGKLQNVCATWHLSPIKTIAQAQSTEVIVAGAGATSNTAIVPKIINELIGTKFKVIVGYDPTGGLNKALEGGEAEGICGLSWSTMKASRPDWIRDKMLNVIVQMGMQKLPDLPDVPSVLDLVHDDEARNVLELILIRQEMGRPIATSPDVPKERVNLLRQAFDATMKDANFRADSERLGLEIDPLSGHEIEALLHKAYAAPEKIIARAAALVDPNASVGK